MMLSGQFARKLIETLYKEIFTGTKEKYAKIYKLFLTIVHLLMQVHRKSYLDKTGREKPVDFTV